MGDDAPAAGDRPPIRVVVAGPDGRMGRLMMDGLPHEPGIEVVGTLRRSEAGLAERVLADADVLLEFTTQDSAPRLALQAIEAGVRPVSGTSGLPQDALDAIDAAARDQGIGAVWASHFRLAGVLALHLARIAAEHLDAVAVVEAHHAGKADAPSGFALEMARGLREHHGTDFVNPPSATTTLPGARGGDRGGVQVHSLRLTGDPGWHEVVFGGLQETLTIRHDDIGRDGYVPMVARAIRKVVEPDVVGLLRGFDTVIGLTPQSGAVGS